MFKFLKKKVKEIKEKVVDPPQEVIFADPILPQDAFKQSDSIDKFIKNLNINKNE